MSGHTKGPWTAWIKGDTIQIDNRGGNGQNPSVVHWGGFDGSELSAKENKANALLIAAAPDLLEAAVSAVTPYALTADAACPPWVLTIRAAITRADGGGK